MIIKPRVRHRRWSKLDQLTADDLVNNPPGTPFHLPLMNRPEAGRHIRWAAQPEVTLYGCNTSDGTGLPAGTVPFSQSISDEFGVPVKGSTTSSHFAFGGQFGVQQVPDKPGKVSESIVPGARLMG